MNPVHLDPVAMRLMLDSITLLAQSGLPQVKLFIGRSPSTGQPQLTIEVSRGILVAAMALPLDKAEALGPNGILSIAKSLISEGGTAANG